MLRKEGCAKVKSFQKNLSERPVNGHDLRRDGPFSHAIPRQKRTDSTDPVSKKGEKRGGRGKKRSLLYSAGEGRFQKRGGVAKGRLKTRRPENEVLLNREKEKRGRVGNAKKGSISEHEKEEKRALFHLRN